MHGIINLDKPAGISSAQAVGRVKRMLPKGTKIGHAGTLDPFATGVLLLLVGKATKLCESLMDQPKQYHATVMLGSTTATDDPESPQERWPASNTNITPPAPSTVDLILPKFVGEITQQPPIYSALRVNGRRAYALARAGQVPVLSPRKVQVYSIQNLGFSWPSLELKIDCGRGTYIRSLARDIGAVLDVGGHLTRLRRTRVGQFTIDSAVSLADLDPISVERHLHGVRNLAG